MTCSKCWYFLKRLKTKKKCLSAKLQSWRQLSTCFLNMTQTSYCCVKLPHLQCVIRTNLCELYV
jgi:hypothetical protein